MHILLVDDDPLVRDPVSDALRDGGFDVTTAENGTAALAALSDADPDIVVTDIRMPDGDGLELLETLRERAPEIDVVMLTAFDDMQTIVRAMRAGAFDFLTKPLDPEDLLDVVRRAGRDRELRERTRRSQEDEAQAYALDQLVGRDSAMIELYKLVGKLAANRVNVLIRGETGTGKELVARAIHFNSPQSGEPFIAVNCTALPGPLLESELFGHVKGAFTGAVSDRRGRFALAGQGTIFLDEIGDTSPEFQSKILRVLERGEYHPVGADQPQYTEARVLAASHRDVEALIADGTFREDLYYRLRVAEVRLPPLRDRRADIPLLAEHFLDKVSRDLHRTRPTLSPDARSALQRHPWPGNVRELEHCLTRAIVAATGEVIHAEHLLGGETAGSRSLRTLAEVERAHIKDVLAATGWNKTKASEVLGVSKPRLYRLIEKHELSDPS